MCRKWSGGVIVGVQCTKLDIADTSSLGLYQASEWGERGFCRHCGSNIFWRTQDGSFTTIFAGSLDDTTGFVLTTEIFVDEKPEFYSFVQETEKMTGAEVFAAFQEGKSQ